MRGGGAFSQGRRQGRQPWADRWNAVGVRQTHAAKVPDRLQEGSRTIAYPLAQACGKGG